MCRGPVGMPGLAGGGAEEAGVDAIAPPQAGMPGPSGPAGPMDPTSPDEDMSGGGEMMEAGPARTVFPETWLWISSITG